MEMKNVNNNSRDYIFFWIMVAVFVGIVVMAILSIHPKASATVPSKPNVVSHNPPQPNNRLVKSNNK